MWDHLFNNPMLGKLSLAGTSLATGSISIAESSGVHPDFNNPASWIAVLSTLGLAIMVIMDRRKVARADTSLAILSERDKLVEAKNQMIANLQGLCDSWKQEHSKVCKELDDYRTMHHTFINDAQGRILHLTAEATHFKTLLTQHNIDFALKA